MRSGAGGVPSCAGVEQAGGNGVASTAGSTDAAYRDAVGASARSGLGAGGRSGAATAKVGHSGTNRKHGRDAGSAESSGGRSGGAGVAEARGAAWCREAELDDGAVGKCDEDGRSKVEIEEVADLNIEFEGDTSNKRDLVRAGNRALGVALDGNESRCVVEEADPDGHLCAGTDLKAKDVNTGVDADSAAQAEAQGQIDSGLEVDISTQANGEDLGNNAITAAMSEGGSKTSW